MKKLLVVCFSTMLLGHTAMAGDISGKVPSGVTHSAGPAVVWVEGVKHFTVPARKPVVAQHKGEFTPAFLVVVAGQSVEMPNEDLVAHNVYSSSTAKSFDLGYYAQGEHKEVTFERSGLVELGCSLHKFMHGQILVVPNPYFAQVSPDGSFEITGLPAGNYTLKLWNDGERGIGHVVVPSTGTAVLRMDIVETVSQRGSDGTH
jgi:plastocyanin